MNSIEALISDLIYGTPDIREKSKKEISRIGEAAIDYLLPLISHEDHTVKKLAASILCDMADKKLIDRYMEFLKEEDDELRKKGIEALGRIGDPIAVSPLIGQLGHRNVHIRISAIEALVRIGEASVEKLLKALENPVETVRESAAYALGKIKAENAIPKLIPLLADTNLCVRMAAAHALSGFGKKAVSVLIDLLEEKNDYVRESVAYALGEIGDIGTVPYLIEMLKDKNPFVRISSARALGKIRDERAIGPLVRLINDKNIFVRMAVAYALGKIGTKESIESLLKLYSDENMFVCMAAANAFIELKERAFEHILKFLSDNDPALRKASARALGKIRDERAIVPLLLMLWDENEDVTLCVEETLHAIDPLWYTRDEIRQYIPYFSEALKQGSKHVRLCIIRVLDKMGEMGIERDTIQSILGDYIKDADRDIRLKAALTIEKLKRKIN